VLPNYGQDKPTQEGAQAKRQRSLDLPGPSAKRPKIQRSADLYKQAKSKLGEVHEGANIVALDWCDVPSRLRARIWITAAIKAPEDILYMQQECNPHLPTKDWKVVKVEKHEGDVNQAVLVLNKDSVALIETPRGVLNFGFSAIYILEALPATQPSRCLLRSWRHPVDRRTATPPIMIRPCRSVSLTPDEPTGTGTQKF